MVKSTLGEVEMIESGLGEFEPFPPSLSSMCKSNSFVCSRRESRDASRRWETEWELECETESELECETEYRV